VYRVEANCIFYILTRYICYAARGRFLPFTLGVIALREEF